MMVPACAGLGDAVTGINRADTASWKLSVPMLRQCTLFRNHSGCLAMWPQAGNASAIAQRCQQC